jgi:hypothetical protein
VRTSFVWPLLIALAVCGCSGPASDAPVAGSLVYEEPGGRFVISHPAGWSLSKISQAGIDHWRWTPEPLPDASADAPSELAFALIPFPPDVPLTAGGLKEIGEYVRDAVIETAGEVGTRLRAGPPQQLVLGKKEAVRYDLEGADKSGESQMVSVVVVRALGRAGALSFGCPKAEAGALFIELERCALTLRLPTTPALPKK